MHQVQPAAASSSQLYQHSPYSCAVKTTLPRSSIKLPCISYPAGYLPHSDQAPEHSPTTHVNFLRLCLYPSTSPASPHGPILHPTKHNSYTQTGQTTVHRKQVHLLECHLPRSPAALHAHPHGASQASFLNIQHICASAHAPHQVSCMSARMSPMHKQKSHASR
jgi:hypothetical protein